MSDSSQSASTPQPALSYNEQLKQDFNELIDSLDLENRQKYYLKTRWLDQVLWIENRASEARDWYYRFKVTAIIGSVLVPVLVSLNPGATKEQTTIWRYLTAGISAVVAGSTAIEQFFNYGERWRNYRRSAEELKSQGWKFFELGGPYKAGTHAQMFGIFHETVEEIIQRDVAIYSSQVVQESEGSKREDKSREEES